jgi:predicted nucleic acid-binding protein
LNEFANVARRKHRLTTAEILDAEKQFSALFEIVPISVAIHDKALAIAERYRFRFYDSLIVAGALEHECNVLYSEDLQHGQRVDRRLKIVNPFV